jgi:hypothetical protein
MKMLFKMGYWGPKNEAYFEYGTQKTAQKNENEN